MMDGSLVYIIPIVNTHGDENQRRAEDKQTVLLTFLSGDGTGAAQVAALGRFKRVQVYQSGAGKTKRAHP
jgi:hypothetical protein